MLMSGLTIPKDVQIRPDKPKKPPTEFERKRAAATTYEELVRLGYEEGFEFPEGWAEHVIQQRRNKA